MDNRQFFLQNVAQTSDFPLALEFPYAEGRFLYNAKGEKYLDFISGISVSNIGHRHPKVVEAIKNQADSYLHQMVFGEYIQAPQIKLAQALVATLANFKSLSGHFIDNLYFTNSGTEAVEGAIKLAKRFTGKPDIVALEKSYHGSTTGALALGEEHFKRNFRPLMPGVKKIRRNNFEDLSKIDKNTAAVIIEIVGAESGIRLSNLCYFKAVADKCKNVGALLVFDEIQTGFGRTGPFWAHERYGIAPDILLSAKGMGGGMPIGAFMAPQHIMGVLKDNPILGHISTFGGHPVSCAASLATLNVILTEIKFEETNRKGQRIRKILEKHPKVSEVRGLGLMLAAQMADFETLKKEIDLLIENKLITDWFLYCDDAMRICPPLNISDEEIDLFESIFLNKTT
jgi:acetylornithine/N-succinyldiaminopimelate aminotransferase